MGIIEELEFQLKYLMDDLTNLNEQIERLKIAIQIHLDEEVDTRTKEDFEAENADDAIDAWKDEH